MFDENVNWFIRHQRFFCKHGFDNPDAKDPDGKKWDEFRKYFVDFLKNKDYLNHVDENGHGWMLIKADDFGRTAPWFGFTTKYYDFIEALFSGNLIENESVGKYVQTEPFAGDNGTMKVKWESSLK